MDYPERIHVAARYLHNRNQPKVLVQNQTSASY